MSESVQKKLLRVRPPRIKITYDIETEGALITKELPGVFGMICDLSGMRDPAKDLTPYKERKFIYLDPENFSDVLKSMTPRVVVPTVSADGKETKNIELIFECLDDFEPLNLVKKIDFLNALYEEKRKLTDLRMKSDINTNIGEFLDKMMADSGFKDNIKGQATAGTGAELDQMIETTHFCHNPEQKPYACDLILNYCSVIEKNTDTNIKTFIQLCVTYISTVDTTISYYLNAILHNPDFQKLEGTWRGIGYVLQNVEYASNLKLRILNASSDELFNDLTKAMEFDQSSLFKKVYEEEYGTFGGTPFSAMMWDYALGRTAQDFMLLRKLTEVMAAAHCPLFIGTSSSLFDLKSFELLHQPFSISKIFDSVEVAELRGFRESPDSKYTTLLLPRIIARLPYNTNVIHIEGLNFEETVSGLVSEEYTWMNAAFAYLTKTANSYAESGWFSSISGVENGGRVDDLPLHIYKNTSGEYVARCPTEVAITDRREKELSDLGFVALCNSKDENFSVFFGSNSAFKPPVFNSEHANANAQISRETPYMLNTSRFAHYLKCMMRDKVGSFFTKEEVKNYLGTWLSGYTILDDKASSNMKAQYPLRGYSIEVEDIPGKPGNFKAIVLLQPHGLLDAIEISLRLVSQMPK